MLHAADTEGDKGLIDIHAHILPGVDDGAGNGAEAVEAARLAFSLGVEHIVATPHVIPGVYRNDRNTVLEAVAGLQRLLDEQGVSVQVFPGAEYYVEPDLPEKAGRGELVTLNNQGRHVLVELPIQSIPGYVDRVLFDLLVQGVTPVLAHPERNAVLAKEPDRMYQLIQKGVLVQVTAGSLVGMFGREVRAAAVLFVRQRWVHFVASDLHGPGGRLSSFLEAVDVLDGMVGAEARKLLVAENPRRVLDGLPVAVGEPLAVSRRTGFFGRMTERGRK